MVTLAGAIKDNMKCAGRSVCSLDHASADPPHTGDIS